MKKVHISVFFIVLALVAAISVLAVLGVYTTYGEYTTTVVRGYKELISDKSIGNSATIVLKTEAELDETQLASAKKIIERRLDEYGYRDYQVYVDVENTKIIVELTWVANSSSTLASLATEITKQGLFEIREGDEADEDGVMTGVTLENLIVGGDSIKSVDMDYSSTALGTSTYYSASVNATLDKEGKQALADATQAIIDDQETTTKKISYWLDGKKVGSKTLSEALTNGEIAFSDTTSSAYSVVMGYCVLLDTGALPAKFTVETSYEYLITDNAESALSIALGAALLMLCVLFIVFFKLSGVCASIALLFQAAASVAVFTGLFTDVPKTSITFANLIAAFGALAISAAAYALICCTVSENVGKGLSAKKAVLNSFDKKNSKSLLAYAVAFGAVLAVNLLSSVGLLYDTAVYSFIGYINTFSRLLMIFIGVAFVGMLLFRLMLKAVSGGVSAPDASFVSLFYSKKDKKPATGKGALGFIALVCVAALVLSCAAFIFKLPYSFEKDGGYTIIRTFTDEEIKTSELADKLAELSDKLDIEYGYANSATAYALKVVVPVGVDVTSEQIVAVCDGLYKDSFTTVSETTASGLYDTALLVRVALEIVAACIVAGGVAALFASRVKKLRAALVVGGVSLVVSLLTVSALSAFRVAVSDATVATAFMAAFISIFVSAFVVYAIEAHCSEMKPASLTDAAADYGAAHSSGVLALGVVLALFAASVVVVGASAGFAPILAFGACALAAILAGVVVSYVSGVLSLTK